MPFGREINRLLMGLLIGFICVTGAAAYWAITGANTILLRDDNPRRVIEMATTRRGTIFDRSNQVLVRSFVQDDGSIRRLYLRPAAYGALGYFSFTYGARGVEAAYDSFLTGENLSHTLTEALTNQVLHRPRIGSDIQLTLAMDVQTQVEHAFRGQRGAVIVLSIPSGDVLAIVSAPTFDPNTLDLNWDNLAADPNAPLFDRALQGRYQPGGILQTPLMAAALLTNRAINEPIENATANIHLNGLELSCAVRLPEIDLTFREAYALACPAPFAALSDSLGAETIQAVFDTFRLESTFTIDGFAAPPPLVDDALIPAPNRFSLTDENAYENILGQGELTVSAMNMAMIAAAIVNDGNSPQPNMLRAVRPPNEIEWQPVTVNLPTIPFMTDSTARQIQDLMRETVAIGAAQNAGRPNIDIGGHAALAYSGEGSLSWFIGFATLGGANGAAVAVVLEDSADPGLAADIGGTALDAAGSILRQFDN